MFKKRPIHQYSEQPLTSAIEAVKNGTSIRSASREFGVPKTTIQDRISGRIKEGPRKMGPQTVLSFEEESVLVNWLKELAKTGFPQKKTDLQNAVQKIILEKQQETPFRASRPGEKWYSSFLKRHPDLVLREPEGLTKSRAIIISLPKNIEDNENEDRNTEGSNTEETERRREILNESGEGAKSEELEASGRDENHLGTLQSEITVNGTEEHTGVIHPEVTRNVFNEKELENTSDISERRETNDNNGKSRHLTNEEKCTPSSSGITGRKSFGDHLWWPGPIETQKKMAKEKLPSAISSAAYRKFLEDKENLKRIEHERKEKKKLERKQKTEQKTFVKKRNQAKKNPLRNQKKTEKGKNEQQKIDHEKEIDEGEDDKENEDKTTRIICSACEEELISDVEEDDLKNVGCDRCIRWFHLMCTEFVGLPYNDVIERDFTCYFCS